MGLTVAQYDATPALDVDWDLAMHKIDSDLEAERQRKAANP